MPERDTHRDERFDQVGDEVSAAVTRAASVLQEELSAGIDSARRLQEKLTADRRVDPAAFDEVAGRVRSDTHALIDMVVAQLPATGDRGELTRRYAADAHDVLDSLLDLARLAPELANGLIDRMSRQGSEPTPGPVRVDRDAGAPAADGGPGPVS
ncbi:hypothetical protein TPA0907_35530 [Micromonospora humidisoli]|uniref:hypothetical protein n=1 Tax=unclassified Micromonospora TaxID=2617518 RepID=UPI0022C3F93D|nr:hypothetical protein [Micromonospora sp. AKA109]GHJ09186.1 hypothetical protein TPA0907_35530 [Micromonospora sp. AKA109]